MSALTLRTCRQHVLAAVGRRVGAEFPHFAGADDTHAGVRRARQNQELHFRPVILLPAQTGRGKAKEGKGACSTANYFC